MTYAEELLGYVESDVLESHRDLHRSYLVCYRVLRANDDPRAEMALATAHRLLQVRAAKIADERLRRSFLENVPDHREIVGEFNAMRENGEAPGTAAGR
jgi:hypothetical protein